MEYRFVCSVAEEGSELPRDITICVPTHFGGPYHLRVHHPGRDDERLSGAVLCNGLHAQAHLNVLDDPEEQLPQSIQQLLAMSDDEQEELVKSLSRL